MVIGVVGMPGAIALLLMGSKQEKENATTHLRSMVEILALEMNKILLIAKGEIVSIDEAELAEITS